MRPSVASLRECQSPLQRCYTFRCVSRFPSLRKVSQDLRNVRAFMLIPLLTEYEKDHIAERQSLPERYLGLSDEEMDRRIAAAKATLGRRLVILGHHYQRDEVIKFADYTGDSYKLARQVSQHPDAEFIVFCGVHFMAESADVLSARSSAGDPAGPRRRLFDGRHGRRPISSRSAGPTSSRCSARRRREPSCSGHLHQLRRVDQSVLRRARRRRLHVVERGGDAEVGVGARRADSVPARSASRPQHRLQDGRAARRDGGVGSERDLGRPRAGGRQARAHHPLEGALLGARALHRAADRAAARAASRRPRHRPSRSAVGRRAGGRRLRLDRIHHQDRSARARSDRSGPSAPRSTSSIGSRARCSPTAPSSRSISSAASARRCSASRRTTSCGCSKGSSPARSTTASSCRTTRSTGRRSRSIACSRFRKGRACSTRLARALHRVRSLPDVPIPVSPIDKEDV